MFAPGQVTETSFSPGSQASSHRFAGPHVSRLSTCKPLDPGRPRGPAGPDDPVGPGGPGGPGGPAGPRRPAGPGGPTSPFSPCGPGGPAGPWGPGGPCGPSKQPQRQRAANTATAAIAERIGRPRRLFKLALIGPPAAFIACSFAPPTLLRIRSAVAGRARPGNRNSTGFRAVPHCRQKCGCHHVRLRGRKRQKITGGNRCKRASACRPVGASRRSHND